MAIFQKNLRHWDLREYRTWPVCSVSLGAHDMTNTITRKRNEVTSLDEQRAARWQARMDQAKAEAKKD